MNKAYYDFEFGKLEITYKDEILYSLKVVKNEEVNNRTKFTDKIFKEVEEYLTGKRKEFDIKYIFIGTTFQKQVWTLLEKIPYGKTCTYLDIAKKMGNSKLSRAIGCACNKNPIWLIVPCHRVIGSNNKLVGYAGGLKMKTKLLEIEKYNS